MADAKKQGIVSRILPSAIGDGYLAYDRDGRYGESYSLPVMQYPYVAADEGQYFTATNPTPGTAITAPIQATFSDTVGLFCMRNNDSTSNSSAKRIYMDYIRLVCIVAPTSATAAYFAIKTDGASATRYTSGGTALTPVNVNTDSPTGSIAASVTFGALTLAASSGSARLIENGSLTGVIPAVGDEYVIKFGSTDGGGCVRGASASTRLVTCAAPLILGPQTWMSLNMWFPSNAVTAATFYVTAGWTER